MKRPNGSGAVCKLTGKRRKPWCAKTQSVEWDESKGKYKRKYHYIGYYETKEEAIAGLEDYLNHPAKYRKCESNIYFITDGTFIKIGKANNIKSRLADLQCASPYDLTVLKSLHTETEEIAFALESAIHKHFSEKRCRPVTKKGRPCEWFKVNLLEINEFIKTLHGKFVFQEVG